MYSMNNCVKGACSIRSYELATIGGKTTTAAKMVRQGKTKARQGEARQKGPK